MKTGYVLGAVGIAGVAICMSQITASARPETVIRNNGTAATAKAPDYDTAGSLIDIATSRVGLTSSGSPSDDMVYYGTVLGIRSYMTATTSCNVGNATAQWISGSSGNHPLIGQNLYRYHNDRFEQIGYSWLKHSFCAINEFTCGSCSSTGCGTLGVGCADTYVGTRNGTQSGLGPREQIDPTGFGSGGTHSGGHPTPSGNNTIRGRLQVQDADILPGARYILEAHYVTHDELPEQRHNNASWREVFFNGNQMTGDGSPSQDDINFMQTAVAGWRVLDPDVRFNRVDVPNDGRFNVAWKVSDNGDGTWHYEYLVHNMNSDRSANEWIIPVDDDVVLTNVGFHDIQRHSGDGVGGTNRDGTDWTFSRAAGECRWTTDTQAVAPNGNALRWGTAYNFRFDANVGPVPGAGEIGLWKTGTPGSVMLQLDVPDVIDNTCVTDLNGDGSTGFADLNQLLGVWGACPGCPEDLNGDGTVGFSDLNDLLAAWGPCV